MHFDQRFQAVDAIATEVVDGELVLLHLDDGVYFGLDTLGTQIWSWIVEGRTLAQISAELRVIYPDESPETLHGDVQALVHELVAARLVQVHSAPSS